MTPTELIVKCYAVQLLSRRAQLSSWLKYYLIVGKVTLCHGKDRQSTGRTFDETMPLIPAWAGIPYFDSRKFWE
ncbi:hypothetical protein [Methyloglobulus sp.]|uniref:hypothetical protein n=1 Tax=Methyloglobulus sp. TaxID=2518622 RepID=UPI00398A2B34